MNFRQILPHITLITLFLFVSCIKMGIDRRTLNDEEEELKDLLNQLEEEGADINTTTLGVYYITKQTGFGTTPSTGNTISIKYKAYFSDWTEFDSSEEWSDNGIWTFVYGEQQLIPGFENAISIMNTGSHMQFIIPSTLAYGEYGHGEVGAYRTLIYDVNMLDISNSNSKKTWQTFHR